MHVFERLGADSYAQSVVYRQDFRVGAQSGGLLRVRCWLGKHLLSSRNWKVFSLSLSLCLCVCKSLCEQGGEGEGRGEGGRDRKKGTRTHARNSNGLITEGFASPAAAAAAAAVAVAAAAAADLVFFIS